MAETGDILLFRTPKPLPSLLRGLTSIGWDHIAMFVRDDSEEANGRGEVSSRVTVVQQSCDNHVVVV